MISLVYWRCLDRGKVFGLREGVHTRRTSEVQINARVNLDGNGIPKVNTGVKYLDHMIRTLAVHSMIDIDLNASGDLLHHICEDSAICLGEALKEALGDREGIVRFGYIRIPMDESIASASVDLVKRPNSVLDLKIDKDGVEDMPAEDIYHFIRSFTEALEVTLHMEVQYGENDHHKSEAAFKALAIALRQAVLIDSRRSSAPSAKGVL